MPLVRTRPEAAIITAAWRPTVPGLTENAEVRPAGASERWRAAVVLEVMFVASPNACEVSCRIRMGGTRPRTRQSGLCGFTPRPAGAARQKWFPRLCQKVAFGSRAAAELGNRLGSARIGNKQAPINGNDSAPDCHIQVTGPCCGGKLSLHAGAPPRIG